MPIKILMPALSPTMKEGNLTKWHKKEGDKVKIGDLLAEIETDKATMEVESVDEGILGKLFVKEGTKGVKVNQLIAALLEDGEDKSALDGIEAKVEITAKGAEFNSPSSVEIAPAQKIEQKSEAKEPVRNERIFASPLAKRLAEQGNIDISKVSGTGPKGRVVKSDILSLATSGGFTGRSNGEVKRMSPESHTVPLTMMREVIAKRLSESKQNIPHFYLSIDCNIEKLMELRADLNAATDSKNPAYKISVNDLVIKAVGLALKNTPDANLSWNDDHIVRYNNVDVSVAVAIKEGLVTPIIRNADQKSIFDISNEMKDLAVRARNSTLKPQEFQGGSVTISNLGMFGIKKFSAIINPPQSCIFAVGASQTVPVVKDNKIVVSTIVNVTLSCDHRVVDGTVGSELLNRFREYIENPVRLLI